MRLCDSATRWASAAVPVPLLIYPSDVTYAALHHYSDWGHEFQKRALLCQTLDKESEVSKCENTEGSTAPSPSGILIHIKRTISLRFLGIILEVLWLKVSEYNVYITNQLKIFSTCIKQCCLLRSYENTKIKTPKCDIHRSLRNSIINPIFFQDTKKLTRSTSPTFMRPHPQPANTEGGRPCRTAFGVRSHRRPIFSLGSFSNLMSDDHQSFRKLVGRCCYITVDRATPALFKVEHHITVHS